jgi:hypothetical protein
LTIYSLSPCTPLIANSKSGGCEGTKEEKEQVTVVVDWLADPLTQATELLSTTLRDDKRTLEQVHQARQAYAGALEASDGGDKGEGGEAEGQSGKAEDNEGWVEAGEWLEQEVTKRLRACDGESLSLFALEEAMHLAVHVGMGNADGGGGDTDGAAGNAAGNDVAAALQQAKALKPVAEVEEELRCVLEKLTGLDAVLAKASEVGLGFGTRKEINKAFERQAGLVQEAQDLRRKHGGQAEEGGGAGPAEGGGMEITIGGVKVHSSCVNIRKVFEDQRFVKRLTSAAPTPVTSPRAGATAGAADAADAAAAAAGDTITVTSPLVSPKSNASSPNKGGATAGSGGSGGRVLSAKPGRFKSADESAAAGGLVDMIGLRRLWSALLPSPTTSPASSPRGSDQGSDKGQGKSTKSSAVAVEGGESGGGEGGEGGESEAASEPWMSAEVQTAITIQSRAYSSSAGDPSSPTPSDGKVASPKAGGTAHTEYLVEVHFSGGIAPKCVWCRYSEFHKLYREMQRDVWAKGLGAKEVPRPDFKRIFVDVQLRQRALDYYLRQLVSAVAI